MARRQFWGPSRPQRRIRRRWSWSVVLLLAIFAIFAVRRGCELLSPTIPPRAPEVLVEGTYELVRVVDGDTIIVRPHHVGGNSATLLQARVRLIGIDAPESVAPNQPVEPWGPEAADFAREFLAAGKVELRLDRRRKDRYERFLAYVYSEGRMLNEALVRAGLARAVNYPGDSPRVARVLNEAEAEARREKRGIWSD